MSRKRCKRNPVLASIPVVVSAFVTPRHETSERLALVAFRDGTAGTDEFDTLANCRDLLALADTKNTANACCELGYIALMNIMDRHKDTGVMQAEPDEMAALEAVVDFSVDWWKRRSGAAYATAYSLLMTERFRDHQSRKTEAATA